MKTFKEYLTELTDHQKKFIDGFVNLSDDDMKKFNDWIDHHKHAFKKLIQYFKTHKIDKIEITSYEDLQKYLDIAEIEATTKPESKLSHLKDEYKQFEIIEDVKGNKYYTFIPYSLRASCEIASSKIGYVLGRWCVAECKSEDRLDTWIKYTLGEWKGYMMFIKPVLRKTKEAYIRGDHKELGKILHDKDDHNIKNVNNVFDTKTINYIDNVLKQNKKKIEKKYIEYILRDVVDLNKLSLDNIYQISLNITDKDALKKLENIIIEKDKEGEKCHWFAKNIKGADVKKLQDAVIKKDKYGSYCYKFAKDVKGADIKELQKAVIEKDENGYYCYKFARDIEGADIQKLQNAIIEKDKGGEICHDFVLNVKGADINKLKDVIIKKDDTGKLCYEYALNTEGADIRKLENLVIEKDKTGEYCYKFAKDIEGADIQKLEDAVIKKDKMGKWCYRFVKNVEGIVNIKKLEDAVIEKDEEGYLCYNFALNIEGADIQKLEDAVIEKDEEGYLCYNFALNIEGADIQKLEDAVIEKDEEGYWCYEFARDVEGADIQKLQNAIIKKDDNGHWCYQFVRNVKGADIDNILQKMKEKFGEDNEFYKDILKLKKNS